MTLDQDYVLGTNDEEVERLGLQHRIWRSRALDAWRRAGFTAGQTLLDVGCGPGYASLDLAEIAGPSGRVVCIDKSGHFLDVLDQTRQTRGAFQIETVRAELDEPALPTLAANGAWCRWVFAFVKHPRRLLGALATSLKPGGMLVIHEYFDYAAWRLSPRTPAFEKFVETVMATWRTAGGEPDIGMDLPGWLEPEGFRLQEVRPLIDAVRPIDDIWRWPSAFVDVNLRRLQHLGLVNAEMASATRDALMNAEGNACSVMVTPGVLEILAVRM